MEYNGALAGLARSGCCLPHDDCTGADTRAIGLSHIVFDRDGRIALDQDLRDSTAALFEHVPGPGRAIGWIKRQL